MKKINKTEKAHLELLVNLVIHDNNLVSLNLNLNFQYLFFLLVVQLHIMENNITLKQKHVKIKSKIMNRKKKIIIISSIILHETLSILNIRLSKQHFFLCKWRKKTHTHNKWNCIPVKLEFDPFFRLDKLDASLKSTEPVST